MMFLYKDCVPLLEICLDNGTTLFLNSREKGKVKEWYEMMAER